MISNLDYESYITILLNALFVAPFITKQEQTLTKIENDFLPIKNAIQNKMMDFNDSARYKLINTITLDIIIKSVATDNKLKKLIYTIHKKEWNKLMKEIIILQGLILLQQIKKGHNNFINKFNEILAQKIKFIDEIIEN